MIEQKIKKLRIEIDYISKLLACVVAFSFSVRSKVTDNLTLSKMWLGKVLGELKSKNPYPESMNPANNIIEPEADCYNGPISMGNLSVVAGLKLLRREIEKLSSEFDSNLEVYNQTGQLPYNIPYVVFANESKMRLIEAKMWLGIELGEIRDQELRSNDCTLESMKFDKIMTGDKICEKENPGKGGQLGRWPVDRNIAGEKYNVERK